MFPWREIIALVVMLVGIVGLAVPLFPGIFVIWLGILIYGILHGFSTLGIVLFIPLTVLMVIGELLDNLMMGAGARRGGASWISILLAFIAGVVGTFLFPPLGGLIAAPLIVLLMEYWRVRDWRKAFEVLKSLLVGWGMSFVLKFGIGIVMFGLWALWAWKG